MEDIITQMNAIQQLRAAAIKVLSMLSKDEWRTKPEEDALDELEVAVNDTNVIKPEEAVIKIALIKEILWPEGNMDHSWSPDTLEEIAEVVYPRILRK